MHKRFEELCALAATGQITGDAMAVLDKHVKECRTCRVFLQDLVPLKAHVAPVVAGSHARTLEPPEGIRERFLQRATEAGLTLNPGPVVTLAEPLATPVSAASQHDFRPSYSVFDRLRGWYGNLAFRFAVPVAAALVCGVLGFQLAKHQTTPATQVAVLPAHVPAPVLNSTEPGSRAAELALLSQENADAQKRLADLSAALGTAQAEKRDLELKLTVLTQQAGANSQFQQQFLAVAQKLQNADDVIAQLQGDLESERHRAASESAVAFAQQKATEDANARIVTLEARLEQQRELNSAGGMAGDMIAARSLHIVDVYDSGGKGSRKQAFGRVFYVEGKSLVFYAYDLPAKPTDKKSIEFRVWGEQAGLKTVSVNLGVMKNDSPGQGRWVLTCDDPRVLNRINAVFITRDPNPKPDSQPRGNKMMYAFLGSANHP